jgi:hypothetical protein
MCGNNLMVVKSNVTDKYLWLFNVYRKNNEFLIVVEKID